MIEFMNFLHSNVRFNTKFNLIEVLDNLDDKVEYVIHYRRHSDTDDVIMYILSENGMYTLYISSMFKRGDTSLIKSSEFNTYLKLYKRNKKIESL